MRLKERRLPRKLKWKLPAAYAGTFLFICAVAFASKFSLPPQTATFHVDLNDKGEVKTQFTSSKDKVYLGTYRIVINTMNPAIIGDESAVTTSPDTWTDYFQLDFNGWSRNHRIAPPNSQQPQQWTGLQPVTSGTLSASRAGFTLVVHLPDLYLATGKNFLVSVITYISPLDNPGDLHPIDALGPRISSHSPIDFMFFDSDTGNPNVMIDSGGLGDWRAYPADFPGLTDREYRNFDLDALTVFTQ